MSIRNLVMSLLVSNQAETVSNKWFFYRKKQDNPKMRLFCFPYGGGGASLYGDWQQYLPPSLEVCPIQLPGRENRIDEPVITTLDKLLELLMANIQPEFDVPFAFFGHSFGAFIAFELTRYLRKHNLAKPTHLFVSAFPDPRLPTTQLDHLLKKLQLMNFNIRDTDPNTWISQRSEKEINQVINIFKSHGLFDFDYSQISKEILEMVIALFIGDVGVIKNHQYHDEKILDIPITVFLGKQDSWIPYGDHLGWAEHTNNKFQMHELEGKHLFVKESKAKKIILEIIAKTLFKQNSKLLEHPLY